MPVYEFRCKNCGGKLTFLMSVAEFSSFSPMTCTACGSNNLVRLFSPFAIHKPDKAVYEDILSDSRLVQGMMDNDPRALAEWSKKMGDAAGEGTSPEYGEMMQRLERGERWEEVVSEMQKKELSAEEKSETAE